MLIPSLVKTFHKLGVKLAALAANDRAEVAAERLVNFFEGDTPEVDARLARRICHNKSAFYELFLVFLADLVVYLLVDCRDKKRHEKPSR